MRKDKPSGDRMRVGTIYMGVPYGSKCGECEWFSPCEDLCLVDTKTEEAYAEDWGCAFWERSDHGQ